jgi:hypothetical protein
MDDFLAWWPSIVGPRAQYGFRVVFAYADEEHDQFVWAVENDADDFDAVEKEYVASPERAEAFAKNPNVVTGTVISKVRRVDV